MNQKIKDREMDKRYLAIVEGTPRPAKGSLKGYLFKDEKKNFRMHHYKEIMKVLGASEENARKAVEVCEGKANREAIADAYTQTFNKLAQKHPTIKLEVGTEVNQGKEYARGEFKDQSVHFSNNKKESKPAEVVPTDIPEDDISLDDIPFN